MWSPRLNKTLQGLIKLVHFNDFFYSVTIATLLGVTAAKGCLDWRFLLLFPANWMAVGFSCMINDIESAPQDALHPSPTNPNPVALGLLSPRTARMAAILVTVITLALFSLLGFWPFVAGSSSLLLGFLYSYRGTRLKNIHLFDLIVHCLAFAGLQYLTGYLSYASHLQQNWFWPFSFVVSLSIISVLNQQFLSIDRERNQYQNTSRFLGKRTSQALKVIMLVLCSFSAVVSLIINDIIPMWAFILGVILASLLAVFHFSRNRKNKVTIRTQEVLLMALAQAFTMALFLQFLLAWMNQIINFRIF
jgi:4-hydroxybenzoate polyprenyltransferase